MLYINRLANVATMWNSLPPALSDNTLSLNTFYYSHKVDFHILMVHGVYCMSRLCVKINKTSKGGN